MTVTAERREQLREAARSLHPTQRQKFIDRLGLDYPHMPPELVDQMADQEMSRWYSERTRKTWEARKANALPVNEKAEKARALLEELGYTVQEPAR